MSTIAIIPARGGSKRLPRKNVLPIDGQPMLCHPLHAARESDLFDRILVSTEDSEIAQVAESYGATVIKRPLDLAGDRATVVEVCRHALAGYPDTNLFCCIYATAFLLRSESLVNSRKLLDAEPLADFVMGISEYAYSPLQAFRRDDRGYLSYMWPEWRETQSQFQPPLYASNGTFYWARAASFLEEGTLCGRRLKGYVLPNNEAADIDTADDLARALLLRERRP